MYPHTYNCCCICFTVRISASLRTSTKTLDFRRFDSSRIRFLRCEIGRSIGSHPEALDYNSRFE